MTKKEYINPEMEVVKVQTSVQMLAGSDEQVGLGESGSADGAEMPGLVDLETFDLLGN